MNSAIALFLIFAIFAFSTILMVRHGLLPSPYLKERFGLLDHNNGLPEGFTISFEGAEQTPLITKNEDNNTTSVELGNAQVVIKENDRQVTLCSTGKIKIAVYYQNNLIARQSS